MASSAGAGSRKKNKKPRHAKAENTEPFSSDLPGVQKIKSSLRQTRRLLAKETLAADLRVETERKLKSLEMDLAKAEEARKERQNAKRYHKVKFFERRKICRKINQLKKQLEDPESPTETIQESLLEQRIDLNYILHYPKTHKYISLFPPKSSDQPQETTSKTDSRREELRQLVRTAMAKGEMDLEPEQSLGRRSEGKSHVTNWGAIEDDSQFKEAEKTGPKLMKGVHGDAFFDTSDDEK